MLVIESDDEDADDCDANPPAGSAAGPAAPRDKRTHKVHLMVAIGATEMLRRIKQDDFSVMFQVISRGKGLE